MGWVPHEMSVLGEPDVDMGNVKTQNDVEDGILERTKQAEAVIKAEESSRPWKVGQVQYVIDARWWTQFTAWAGVDEKEGTLSFVPRGPYRDIPVGPGPIINNDLLVDDDPAKVKQGLKDPDDYVCRSEETWEYLQKLHGGGPAVPRKIVPMSQGKLRPEVYPITLKIFRWPDYDGARPLDVSCETTVSELMTAACALFELDEKDVQLSDYYSKKIYGDLGKPENAKKKLEEVQITSSQHILLGEQSKDGKWPSEEVAKYDKSVFQRPISGTGSRAPFRMTLAAQDDPYEDSGHLKGLSGLGNLGNTCFMNSSLQCLSHAAPLVRMFLSGAYKQDLNSENPLGNNGKLAEAFGSLLKLLWQGNVGYVSPRAFKQTVGHFAPQFSGYQQHDSQELLIFLLDGLHEDLNRVRQKPYIDEPDANGRPDKVVAQEAWDNHKQRNDSVIVDHFQGMYKSTLKCPQCSNVGVKFDPYMYLSLNLPESKRRTLQVTALYVDGSQPPMQHAVDVPKTGNIGQVYEALARELGLPSDQKPMELLLLIELQQHRAPIKYTDAEVHISDIKERANLMVYRYASQASGPQSNGRESHLFHRRRHHRKRGVSNKEQPLSDMIGAPLVLFLQEEEVQSLQLEQQFLDQWACHVWVRQPNVLDEALLTALRPFKKAQADQNGNNYGPSYNAPVSHAQSSKTFFSSTLGESTTNGRDHNSMEPIRLPYSSATPFGTQSEFPAFGLSSGVGAPPQSPAVSLARTNSDAASDCASIQAQAEFNQPFSDEEDERGQHNEGPHSKSQRLRGASQQSLTGLEDANESAPQSASARDVVDTKMASWDAGNGWGQAGTTTGAPWRQDDIQDNDIQWESADNAENVQPGETVRNGSLEQAMRPHVTPEQTQQHSPQTSAQALEMPLGPSKGDSRARPFDMWAAQNASAEPSEQKDTAEVQPLKQPQDVQYPWQLKCCSQNGETRLYHMPEKGATSLYFAVEWAPESAAQYDVSSLEQPPQSESSLAAQQHEEDRRQSSFTLQECLESFVQKEKLDSAEAWHCPKCKERVEATKKLDLWSTPEILILHLKRFQYTTQSRRKIDAAVAFPLTALDLSPYLIHQQDVPPVYNLFAISQHSGSLGGGHYTATVQYEGRDWYEFNDSGVSRVDDMDPADSAHSAYVLFYRRQDDLRSSPSCMPPALEAAPQEDKEMEDADDTQSLPGSPRRSAGGSSDKTVSGSPVMAARANGNGFLYHVPAAPEGGLEAAVQDVVVSDASADGPTKEEAPEFQSPERPPGSPAENGSFGAFSPPSWPGLDL